MSAWRFFFLVGLFTGAAPAHALVCTANISSISFGSVNVLSSAHADSTATVSISCSGLVSATVRLCLSIGAGTGGADALGRYLTSGNGGTLRYQLYQNAARTTVWGSNSWGLGSSALQIDLPLGLSGHASTTATLYGRVFGGQGGTAQGSYTSVFTGSESTTAYATLALFDCNSILALPPLITNAGFTASASVASTCTVSADAINFGARGVLNTATDASGQLDVTCTTGTAYTLALNGGTSNTAPNARMMKQGNAAIVYGLYRDAARTLAWGDTAGTNTQAGTGTGSAQSFTVYGRVPAQATPASGTYTDTVVVTLTY